MGQGCPQGLVFQHGLCYLPCNEGYSGQHNSCIRNCPRNFKSTIKQTNFTCTKPLIYDRGAGYTALFACENSNIRGAFANGCESYRDLWFPVCDNNFAGVGSICVPTCPPGFPTNSSGSCDRSQYNRGPGSPASWWGNLSGYWIVIIIIAILFIIIAGESAYASEML